MALNLADSTTDIGRTQNASCMPAGPSRGRGESCPLGVEAAANPSKSDTTGSSPTE